MVNLIKAEFRKVLTTKLWWGLLIPTVLLAFGWSFGAGALVAKIGQNVSDDDVLSKAGISFKDLALGVFALSRSINITSIFPMIFGALGLSSELRHRTITTSFLTAPNRPTLLGAKAITYVLWGLIYGVVIAAFASLGTVAGTGGDYMPDAGGFLLIFLAGVLSCLLWTLLGLGLGALLGNPIAALLVLIIYTVILEPIVDLFLPSHIPGVLPNGSADGLTGSTAGQILINQLETLGHTTAGQVIQQVGGNLWNEFLDGVRIAAGAKGAFDWWASGLIFLVWTAIFFVAGLMVNQRRDIT